MRMYGGGWRLSSRREEDADEEVQGGLEGEFMVYNAEEATRKRPLTRQQSCLMEPEGIEGEEAARPGGAPPSH
jgi:hypothetical protein